MQVDTASKAQPAAAAAPLPAGVHLAQQGTDADRQSASRSPFRAYGLDMLPEWAVWAGLTGLLVVGFTRQSALGWPVVPALLGAAGVVGAIVLIPWLAARSRYAGGFPLTSDPTARVRVLGWPWQLAPLSAEMRSAAGRGGTDVCEPESFRVTFAGEPAATLWTRALACIAAAAAGFWLLGAIGAGLPFRNGFLGVLALLAVARTIMGLAWSTTVRIVPRRLHIVRAGLLGAARPAVETFDLTTAPMLVDLRSGRLFIRHSADDPGRWICGAIGRPLKSGRELGLAAVRASLSRFEPPEDEGLA